ncbi:MAG: hypothetical protein KAG61_13590 [Bacteriovoracaceae bacterium]|nr:hypothetical protein [Bacteriovoracaceae bacterium]
MKKLILSSLIIITTALVVFYILQNRPEGPVEKKLITYHKKANGLVKHNTTKKERKLAKIEHNVAGPAQSKRELSPKNSKIDLGDLEYSNKVSDGRNTLLSKRLLNFQKVGTKVVVRQYKSMVIMKGKKGQYVEEVIISFINESGLMNGFSALVDSETGKILKTWNRTTWMIKKDQGIQYQGELR